jgi:ComF family protein
MRKLLHLLKYEGLEPIARRLGALIAARVAAISELPQRMLVVPVPLFKGRQSERGFNQAELLAEGIMRAMRRLRSEWEGEFAPGVLARQRATESQAGLSPHERRRNLRGAFFIVQPERVRERDVLLVDDIYTTGATARACSQALKRTGAATVWVATAARAQKWQIEASRSETIEAPAKTPMDQDVAMWDGGKTLQ